MRSTSGDIIEGYVIKTKRRKLGEVAHEQGLLARWPGSVGVLSACSSLILETAANASSSASSSDPRIGMVSITRVKLTPDLSHAQVWWSALGTEAEQRTTQRGLEDALPVLQRAVAHAMQTRVTPKLEVRHDETLEKAQRLETIFQQLREERGEDDPEDAEQDEDAEETPPSAEAT